MFDCIEFKSERPKGRKVEGKLRRLLAFVRRLTLLLGPAFDTDDDVRGGCDPGPGDMARGGTFGGGPGSAIGDLR